MVQLLLKVVRIRRNGQCERKGKKQQKSLCKTFSLKDVSSRIPFKKIMSCWPHIFKSSSSLYSFLRKSGKFHWNQRRIKKCALSFNWVKYPIISILRNIRGMITELLGIYAVVIQNDFTAIKPLDVGKTIQLVKESFWSLISFFPI